MIQSHHSLGVQFQLDIIFFIENTEGKTEIKIEYHHMVQISYNL